MYLGTSIKIQPDQAPRPEFLIVTSVLVLLYLSALVHSTPLTLDCAPSIPFVIYSILC